MSKNKIASIGFQQKNVDIDGVTYTLQKIPFKFYLELNDRCTNRNGVLMKTQYSEELFKHCVVSPKVTLASFDDDFNAASELLNEVESFLNSKTEQNPSEEESQG